MTEFLKPGMLDGTGAVYDQIGRAIADPILRGEWPPGSRLPPEHELTRLFGTSRMTVNRALTDLAEKGLIVRRRRAGTFVATPTAQHPVLEINDIEAEVRGADRFYRFEIVEREVRDADSADCAKLRLEKPVPVLGISVLHYADSVPFAFEDRLINLRAVPTAEAVSFDVVPPGTWLLKHVPWSEATHRIQAIMGDTRIRGYLDLPRDVPSLLVQRRTRRSGMPVSAVDLYYPGDRHSLVASFHPRQRYSEPQP